MFCTENPQKKDLSSPSQAENLVYLGVFKTTLIQ